MSIRIILTEDHIVTREGLRYLLDRESDLEVVGESGDGREAVKQVRELRALRKQGWSLRQLCKKYGLAVSTMSYIVNRKTYYDV